MERNSTILNSRGSSKKGIQTWLFFDNNQGLGSTLTRQKLFPHVEFMPFCV